MKVSFLCSTFESGQDGVGDYVRRIANTLAQAGHDCQVVAVADRFVSSITHETDCMNRIRVVRVPLDQWRQGDTQQAESALASFMPDWVSLQMVCWGYEHRGLLLRSARSFHRFKKFGKRHIMFHELWIGESHGFSAKERVLGWLQKQLLLRTTRIWSPDVIHTSNPVYMELLHRSGYPAAELPLPGNIPIHEIDAASARHRLLDRLGADQSASFSLLVAGVFGSIHPAWTDSRWLEQLSDCCRQKGSSLKIVHLGRPGLRGQAVWRELRRRYLDRVEFHSLGELSAGEVSTALQGLDFGIATSPWSLVGKSGTVAAMLEHGLPVVVTRNDFMLRRGRTPDPTAHPLLYRFDEHFLCRLTTGTLGSKAPASRLDIYDTLMGDLARIV